MFSKFGLAAAALAIGSLMMVGGAEAQKRSGKGKKAANTTAGQQAKKKSRNKSRTQAKKTSKSSKPKAISQVRGGRKPSNALIARRIANNIWRGAWGGPGFQYGRRFRCVAVARRGQGFGRPIGIRGQGRGFRACRKAMRRCNRKLSIRQAYGRNPRARCMIVARR